MATVTVTKALTNFFNQGEAKLPAQQWLAQLKQLTPAEKIELAELIVEETKDTLSYPPQPAAK